MSTTIAMTHGHPNKSPSAGYKTLIPLTGTYMFCCNQLFIILFHTQGGSRLLDLL